MTATSSTRGFPGDARHRAVIVAIVLLTGAGCGGDSTGPTPATTSTTSAPATTTSTTAPATTTTSTTTTVPGTSTTTSSSSSTTTTTTPPTTTTTSIPALAASFTVQNTPCSAPASGSVSCTFSGAASGGQPPYTFEWRFTNPSNGQVVTATGQQVRPEIGCNVSSGPGTATFNLSIALTVRAGAATATANGTQQMVRPQSACGT